MNGSIKIQEGILVGRIQANDSILYGAIRPEGTLSGSLAMPVGYDDYLGVYQITPKIDQQIINTADKHMTKNITIKEIPYYSVDNAQAGQTIIIGGSI